MLKNISQLEIAIENKLYRFECDIDSSLQSIKEALFQFQKYIGQIEDNIKSQQEQAKQSQQEQEQPQE